MFHFKHFSETKQKIKKNKKTNLNLNRSTKRKVPHRKKKSDIITKSHLKRTNFTGKSNTPKKKRTDFFQ